MAQSKSNGTWGSDSDSDRISLKVSGQALTEVMVLLALGNFLTQ